VLFRVATLTLPGIAGIMLTVGIDGNVLIYERAFAGSPMDLEELSHQKAKNVAALLRRSSAAGVALSGNSETALKPASAARI
jgi:preprotein translocase subunit SecD